MLNLFTTLPPNVSPAPVAAGSVVDAIREGSEKSGADFGYLVKTAQRESSLDPKARATTSTATGLFQFVEQTWLSTLKEAGPRLGLSRYSQAIKEVKSGHFDVADPAMRSEILALRNNPKIASAVAGALTQNNATALTGALGRPAKPEDLYIAHVLGASGAGNLLRLSDSEPDIDAAQIFPDAAKSNPALFFNHDSGEAKSVDEVRRALVLAHQSASAPQTPSFDTSAPSESEPPATVLAYAHPDGPALYSLFRTVGQTTPLNDVVRDLWSTPDSADAQAKPSYFPRSAAVLIEQGDRSLPPLIGPFVNVPLPPVRSVKGLAHSPSPAKPIELTSTLKEP